MSWEGLNRRKFPRAKFPCLLKLTASDHTVDTVLTHTENISVGGVCVIIKMGLERSVSMTLELDLMDGEDVIRCKGQVIWVIRRKAIEDVKPSYYDTGIEFVDIREDYRKRVEKLVEVLFKNEQKVAL